MRLPKLGNFAALAHAQVRPFAQRSMRRPRLPLSTMPPMSERTIRGPQREKTPLESFKFLVKSYTGPPREKPIEWLSPHVSAERLAAMSDDIRGGLRGRTGGVGAVQRVRRIHPAGEGLVTQARGGHPFDAGHAARRGAPGAQ